MAGISGTGRSSTDYYEAALYGVVERTRQLSLRQLIKQPGIRGIHRVTCYYAHGQARHSVATLTHTRSAIVLNCIYEGLFDQSPLMHSLSELEYERFCQVLHQVHFDRLAHQDNIPLNAPVIWQLERAAGQYIHAVMMTPTAPPMPYSALVNAIDAYMPQAIKPIPK